MKVYLFFYFHEVFLSNYQSFLNRAAFLGRAFQGFEGIRDRWEQDKNFLQPSPIAGRLFDNNTLGVVLDFAKKKHL